MTVTAAYLIHKRYRSQIKFKLGTDNPLLSDEKDVNIYSKGLEEEMAKVKDAVHEDDTEFLY